LGFIVTRNDHGVFSGKVCRLGNSDGFQRPYIATHNIFITVFYRVGGTFNYLSRVRRNKSIGRINTLTSVLSGVLRYFNRWRLVLSIFLLVYTALLVLDLSYNPILWDETPHLFGGLLLSRGHLQEYIQEGSFYPPLFDVTTVLYFKILGLSVFSARFVAVTFGILSAWCVFEYAYRIYGPRNALVSSVFLASMPGFIWLCRMALTETMVIFFFSISLLLFFSWMNTNKDKMLILSGLALGLGFLAKYQVLVGGIIMLVSMFFMWRERIMTKLGKFSLMLIIAGAVALPWIFFTRQKYAAYMFEKWLYALRVGNEERLVYNTRFPLPIFYLIEMTYPYPHIHPISLPIYILALLGLCFWLWRRRREDKFSLIWFFVVYSVFTLIPNRNWRYVTPVFPILAVSASDFILFIWDKAKDILRDCQTSLRKANITKVAITVFMFLVVVSIFYSSRDAYLWVEQDHVHVPVEEASQYVAKRSALNETVVVLCAGNFFSGDLVEFYLQIYNPDQRPPWQYPELPVDAYTFLFNETMLIEHSEALHVKYLLLYEHGNITFFQSEWRAHDVLEVLLNTSRFAVDTELGTFPRRIFIMRFFSNS
jgi:4-amino-4-deoxy-L-arabinose transferase-like glycosyltransferase